MEAKDIQATASRCEVRASVAPGTAAPPRPATIRDGAPRREIPLVWRRRAGGRRSPAHTLREKEKLSNASNVNGSFQVSLEKIPKLAQSTTARGGGAD